MRPAAEGYEHARKDPADAVKAIVEHKADHDAVYRRKVLDLILSKIAGARREWTLRVRGRRSVRGRAGKPAQVRRHEQAGEGRRRL